MSHSGSFASFLSRQNSEYVEAKGNRAIVALCFFSSALVAMCAMSPESLWTDEFGTWNLARADSIADWWARLQSAGSDSQIPLYHLYMYEWTKVFGTDAVAMRASNAWMFVVGNLALLWPFRSRANIAIPLILVTSLSAPIWYFLNEIRPYIMLYMGICLMVGASIEIASSSKSPSLLAITALCIGAVVSSGATVIGIAWAGSVCLFLFLYWMTIKKSPLKELVDGSYLTLAIAAFCIAALFAHDIRMFTQGKLPALLGKDDVLTLFFSFYANLGLLGVGPGMLDLRENGVAALVPFAPIVAFSAVILGLVALAGLLELKAMVGGRTLGLLIGCVLLPTLFIFGFGLILHWRPLPRHFIPLVSLFSLLYSFGIARCWRHRVGGMALALMSVIIMGYSSISVRYAPRHAKDDYKRAAELALIELAHGGRVWWIADPKGAVYYGIAISDVGDECESSASRSPEVRINVAEKTPSFLTALPLPTLVLLSKPDAWDKHGVVSNYLSAHRYELVESFPAFTAWRMQKACCNRLPETGG